MVRLFVSLSYCLLLAGKKYDRQTSLKPLDQFLCYFYLKIADVIKSNVGYICFERIGLQENEKNTVGNTAAH